jgi:hypothetical protein
VKLIMNFALQIIDVESWLAATSAILLLTSEALSMSKSQFKTNVLIRPSMLKNSGIMLGVIFVAVAVATLVSNYFLALPP